MTTRVRLTYEDDAALPDDGRRYELHEGELSGTPAPGTSHQDPLANLFVIIRGHVSARRLGRVFFAPVDCILDDITVVRPEAGTLSGTTTGAFLPFPDLTLDPGEIWPAP
jgi:Uma2 family endonuclease